MRFPDGARARAAAAPRSSPRSGTWPAALPAGTTTRARPRARSRDGAVRVRPRQACRGTAGPVRGKSPWAPARLRARRRPEFRNRARTEWHRWV